MIIRKPWWRVPGMCLAGCGAAVDDVSFRCKKCAERFSEEVAARKAAILSGRKSRAAVRKFPKRTDAEAKWRAHVGRSVRTAVALGLLPDPVNCTCVDCGKNAECYDHRDYSKPLDVDPVCLPCNSSRHRGEMPKPKEPSDFPLTEKGERWSKWRQERPADHLKAA